MDQIARLEELLRQAQERAEQAEALSRPTTLKEFLTFCHDHLDLKVAVESDKSLTSKGTITNPQDKAVPSKLLPWTDFFTHQKNNHGRLRSAFPQDQRAFGSLAFLQELGRQHASKKIANERDLEIVQHDIVEAPVARIIEALRNHDATKREFALGQGVTFDNHPNALSDGARDSNQLRADQVCVFRHADAEGSGRLLAFVIEYKAPHKLTPAQLRLGLREMNIKQEVIDRQKIPTDENELFIYHAERVVAAAVCQTYHYMITSGLRYSYLSTGEAIVFLKVDWSTPEHLLFHLAEPRAEVLAHPDNAVYCTAISQVLAFTILAIEEQPFNPGQDERSRVMKDLGRWSVDYDAVLRDIPRSVRKSPPSSAYAPKAYRQVNRSPYGLRSRATGPTCRPASVISNDDDSSDQSDNEGGRSTQKSPSLRNARLESQPRQPRTGASQDTHTKHTSSQRQYCTQQCLLGLARRTVLDMGCPNVGMHQQGDSQYHPVNLDEWLQLIQNQLAKSLDTNIVKLDKQGARGAAFQVTLARYGYTIVAKGTASHLVEDLQHEVSVYKALETLQGIHVPVFLGAFKLERPYYYLPDAHLVYWLLLSWAGEPMRPDQQCSTGMAHARHAAEEAVKRLGVVHGDLRDANVLWNSKTDRVMLIDFDCATLPVHPPATGSQQVGDEFYPQHRMPLHAIATNRLLRIEQQRSGKLRDLRKYRARVGQNASERVLARRLRRDGSS